MKTKFQNSKISTYNLRWVLPLFMLCIIITSCTTELDAISVKETNVNKELPTLQGFVFGTKDYYKNVTQEEIDLVKAESEKMKTWIQLDPRPDYSDFFDVQKSLESYRITKKIRENGSTVVVDTDNGMIITITESPDGSVYYTGNSFEEQLNMSREEYNAYVSKLKNATSDQKDIEEHIMEVEELESFENNTDNIVSVPFAIIEKVPTYPGCDGDNDDKKKCLQENIQRFVANNFDTSIANKASSTGKQTISVQFKINAVGKITNIISRSKNPELQVEAARVVNLLPRMQPGKQRGQPVNVIYALPIIFNVNEASEEKG